jgi:hypothetical protein
LRSIEQEWNRAEPLIKTNRAIMCRVLSIHHNSIFPKISQNQCHSIIACGFESWRWSASECDQKWSDIISQRHWPSKTMTSPYSPKIHGASEVLELVEGSTGKTFTWGVISHWSWNLETQFHHRTKVSTYLFQIFRQKKRDEVSLNWSWDSKLSANKESSWNRILRRNSRLIDGLMHNHSKRLSEKFEWESLHV